MAVKMVNAIPRTIPTVAVFSAMCPLLVPSRRVFMGNNRRRCVSYFTLSPATLSQLTGQPKKRPKLLVPHILNWGPEEKAPPKRGLKCTGITPLHGRRASAAGQFATRQLVPERKAPPKRGVSGDGSRPLNLSSVKDADRQPLVTTGAGGGYLPIGALPTGHLPTGGGAGGGGSLRGRSAAAAALSIAKDAASAVRIFSMM